MKELISTRSGKIEERLTDLFPSTGRALFFNFAALALGFAVLITSEVPPLVKFGMLVAVAVTGSFAASMTILPAIAKIFQPAFLFPINEKHKKSRKITAAVSIIALLIAAAVSSFILMDDANAQDHTELPIADDLIEQVNSRDDGEHVSRVLTMELTDRRGNSRVRETIGYRRYYGDEKRTVLFYRSPSNVKGTGFLTYDYSSADTDDDQWLYLPALRRVRRISASDRGDYFLGTDFTYEDIKKETKIASEEYSFTTLRSEVVDGHMTYVVEGTPVTRKIAEELGYGRVIWRIDPEIWMSRSIDMWDVNGNHLKTLHNEVIENIQGIWTSLRLTAVNHKTGHSTVFTFSEVDYEALVEDNMFEQRALKRGR